MSLKTFLEYLNAKGFGPVGVSEDESYFFVSGDDHADAEKWATLVWVEGSSLNLLASLRKHSTTGKQRHEIRHYSIPLSSVTSIESEWTQEITGNGLDTREDFTGTVRFDSVLGVHEGALCLPLPGDQQRQDGDRDRLVKLLDRIQSGSS